MTQMHATLITKLMSSGTGLITMTYLGDTYVKSRRCELS